MENGTFNIAVENYYDQWLTEERGAEIKYMGPDSWDVTTTSLYYSLDNGTTWSEYFVTKTEANISEEILANGSIYVAAGNKILFKGNNFMGCTLNCTPAPIFTVSEDVNTQSNQRFNVEGNIMSLIYGDNFVGQTDMPTSFIENIGQNGFFTAIFMNNTSLIDAENLILPLTTVYENCYSEMFSSCTSLITAPKLLPATTLAERCYSQMFSGCTSLITAPKLLATELVQWCYGSMFEGCTNLKNIVCYAKNLEFDDIYSQTYTEDWVKGVNTKNGSFVKDSSSVWPTTWPENEYGNFAGIPVGWTIKNK